MHSPSPRSPAPTVALAVEPRLLRDVLARALVAGDVVVLDTEGVPDRCDVLVTSEREVPAGVADLVVFVDPADASTGIGSVSDLVERIRAGSIREGVSPVDPAG